MKNVLMFSIVALLTTITTASAAEPIQSRDRLFRFDFNCEFERGSSHETKDREFEAVARVFARVRHEHNSGNAEVTLGDAVQIEGLRNLLAVARNGNLFYSDGAVLISTRRKVTIAAATGEKLAIVIPRRDNDSVNAEWMKHEAFLVIGERKIPGTCNVRAKPVERGHEYDDENRETELSAALN